MPSTNVTDATFQEEVLDSPTLVIVDFWADWCVPCRQIAPVLEELSEVYADRLKLVKLDTMANPRVTAAYGIVSIPTLNFYSGGSLVKSLVGARPKQALVKAIDEVLETVGAA